MGIEEEHLKETSNEWIHVARTWTPQITVTRKRTDTIRDKGGSSCATKKHPDDDAATYCVQHIVLLLIKKTPLQDSRGSERHYPVHGWDAPPRHID